MKLINRLFLFVLCVGFFSSQINAQSKSGSKDAVDVRVAKALSQVKTEYQVGKDGDYKIIYLTTGKRTQTAWINSVTDIIYGVEMRLVFSFAVIGGNAPSQEVANLLLEENFENLSTWSIQKVDKGKFNIINMIYIPADSDGKTLNLAVSNVMVAADKLEERLSKKDEF
ncbi:MAG: hypothetical protein H0W45_05125 [Acidobacteria bacterium]|nr:hypothetical protein [Acidobacteriota bacterium]